MALSNARVIAAVPLMLAALVRVGCQDGDGCPDEHDGRCFVCAAIAKAVTP